MTLARWLANQSASSLWLPMMVQVEKSPCMWMMSRCRPLPVRRCWSRPSSGALRNQLAREKRGEKRMAKRVAVVTGAARGIGRAIVERLMCDGFTVAIADMNLPEAQSTREQIARAEGDSGDKSF